MAAPLAEFTQFEGARPKLSCKTKPGVAGVHEIVAWPGAAGTMVRSGAPTDCTAMGKAQKPPVTEYWPLVNGPPRVRLADGAADGIDAAGAGATAAGDLEPVNGVALGEGGRRNQEQE